MYDNPPSVDQRTVCALTDASVKGGTWVLLGIDWTWLHVEDSPHCACDQVNEDPYHYFFVCPFYKVQRVQMMNDLSQYITGIPRLSHILYGNDALSETYNKYIFIIVHKFIKDTERFKN